MTHRRTRQLGIGWTLVILACLVAGPAVAQTTMTTAQKIELTVTPVPVGSLPAGTILVWSVEGSSATNILGTFVAVTDKLAAWYLPIKGGTHVVRVSFTVDGTTTPGSANLPITVTYLPPTSVTIVAAPPIPR